MSRSTGLALAMAGLALAGAAHWVLFLGREGAPLEGPSFVVEDWPKEHRYFSILRHAVTEGRVPYYISRPVHTRKFLALPEVPWSPQIVLLRWVPPGSFVIVQTVLLYAAGLVGCLLLARRHGLGAIPIAFFVLIFSLNGHITAHLAVGHSAWAGYFLLPFVLLATERLIEDPGDRRPGIWLGLALSAIALQGAIHVFTWCVLFLLVLGATGREVRWAAGRALVWALALSACRLLPAYFLLNRKDQTFLSGFPSVADLWHGLVTLRGVSFEHRGGAFGALGWWEYDTYVGLVGLAWLLVFGLALRVKGDPAGHDRQPRLHVPMAILAVLALDDLYAVINVLGIPLLSAQRVSSRLLALPLVWLALLAAVRMQRWIETERGARPASRIAAVAALVVLALSLGAHSARWRVARLEAELLHRGGNLEIDIADPPRAPRPVLETAYMATVNASILVSLAAAGAAAWRLSRRATA